MNKKIIQVNPQDIIIQAMKKGFVFMPDTFTIIIEFRKYSETASHEDQTANLLLEENQLQDWING